MLRSCSFCKKKTAQKPFAGNVSGKGCTFVCGTCNNITQTLSFDAMMTELNKKLANELPFEVSTIDTSRMRVFVKHHAGDAELPQEAIREHIRITGTVPEVGKKLMALPKGMNHKAFAIPISEVVRIVYTECEE
jgi:5-carboxymethyl-2-hydroxymuconate isomerase